MLDKRLADVRRNGYAKSVDEAAPGMASVAAPIFDGAGECIAAISVAGPVNRMPEERLDQLARQVLSAAASVSATSARSA